jgi:hypothetical protein
VSALKAMLLTLCSTALAVVCFAGLYRGLQPAVVPAPRPALSAGVGAPGGQPARPSAGAAAPADEEFQYCRPGMAKRPRLTPGQYDAVFALGAGLAGPNADLEQVLTDGARLRPLAAWLAVTHYRAAPTLGFSGGQKSSADGLSQAASMRQFVDAPAFRARFGPLARTSPEGVVLDEESTTTDANVAQILELARQHRWSRVLLVTNQYHVPRARLLAEVSRLPADAASAEALVDGAMGDPKVRERLCAHEQSEANRVSIRQEQTYMSVIRLLRI